MYGILLVELFEYRLEDMCVRNGEIDKEEEGNKRDSRIKQQGSKNEGSRGRER